MSSKSPDRESEALRKSEVDYKIRKYEDKIDLEMRPQLHNFIKKRDQIYEELAQYL